MTFIGLPIEGDKTQSYDRRVEQHDRAELEGALRAVLAFPEVEALRWYQYTPYFNDGDPCVFSVGGAYWKFTGEAEEEDYSDYGDGFTSGGYGEIWDRVVGEHEWEGKHPDRVRKMVSSPNPELFAAAHAANAAIEAGHHDDYLLELFGDHAIVTATREKIEIEFYEHD